MTARSATEVHVLGVRHHGPGSARAVRAALEELDPDLVLIEGPPELDGVAALAASPAMVPPVAALVYAPDRPALAAFYPMASFSPEWIALRHALTAGRPVRFVDLPAAVMLAHRSRPDRPEEDAEEGADGGPGRARLRSDPMAALAEAAGYADPERWWEDAIEHRAHGVALFDVVTDAMRALREHAEPDDGDEENDRREAAMRRSLRAAMKEGHRRLAVVCGAWHAPALVPDAHPPASADDAVLRGLSKVKVEGTWVPWTSGRLASESGYGAGVSSPGWYSHLFTCPDDTVARWMVKVAGLLRDEGIESPPASVVEAVRLADALAAVRGRPVPGLAELMESTEAVLCAGSPAPLALVARRLLVGEELGSVPEETPMVPLARDLASLQRRLRLKPSAAAQTLDLDLRTPSHLERSRLLHRLGVIHVPWGTLGSVRGTKGTFRESWSLEWRPELSVALIEAAALGTTVEAAAGAAVEQRAAVADDLRTLTELVELALLADLPLALKAVMAVLADRAAERHDVAHLMGAVEPLARVRRYGDVRRADTGAVHTVLSGLVTRVAIGLAPACASLDDEAAAQMHELVDSVQRGVATIDDDDLRATWGAAVAALADQRGVHGLLAGRATRLLLDGGRLDTPDAHRRLSLALSRGADPAAGAAWVDGFLAGDVTLLLHDPALLGVIDGWVADAPPAAFDDLLPLLRRTFGRFTAPERRLVGERVRHVAAGAAGTAGTRPAGTRPDVDPERAARVLPRLRQLLGAPP